MKDIDLELLKILNSNCQNNDYITYIQYLFKAKVLDTIEEKLCDILIEQLELTHSRNLIKALEKLEFDVSTIKDIDIYKPLELTNKIDEFILKRKQAENGRILSLALEQSITGDINKEATDLIFNRYVDIIDIPDDDSFDYLEEPYTTPEIEISTASEFIDSIIGGLPNGTITTIVGDHTTYKSLWAINIVYHALVNNKNVLYISLGTNRGTVYKRLLARHSCDIDKFSKTIKVDELNIDYDEDNYKAVYYDFKSNHLDRLMVFDENHFRISTYHNLQKLLVYAQGNFMNKYECGINLIVIDDFTFMRLDNGKRSITNKNAIINEYYKYLSSQSKNLLGTQKSIPVLITICDSDNSYGATVNNGSYTLDCVFSEVKISSDNILTIYGDKGLKTKGVFKLQIIQSICGEVMEESKDVAADYEHWHLKYNAEVDTTMKTKLEEEKKFNSILEIEVSNKENSIHEITDLLVNRDNCKTAEIPAGQTLDEMLAFLPIEKGNYEKDGEKVEIKF